MPVPTFTPRNYFNASREHLGLALRLREQGEYFAAHYQAGIAVEDILRALSVKEGESFDGTHDIQHWAEKSNLLVRGAEAKHDAIHARILEVSLRWRANQRYYTLKMLDTWLHHINLDGRVRGDRIKVSSERMLELVYEIVSLGEIRWNKKS